MDTTTLRGELHHLVVSVRSTNSSLMHGKCIDDGLVQIAKSIPLCAKALRTVGGGEGGFISPNLAVEHIICENAKRF